MSRDEAAIIDSIRQMTATIRRATAEYKFSLAISRLQQALKAGYNPEQPRRRDGTAQSGWWASFDVAQVGGDDPVRYPDFYGVDLAVEDAKGGHGKRDHVEKSQAYLTSTVDSLNFRIRLPDGDFAHFLHRAEGTFLSLGEANNLVSQVLRLYPEKVEQAINGKVGDDAIKITHRFGFQTGVEAYRATYEAETIIRKTYWVEIYISHDPNRSSRRYRVVTAYPMNETPNEELR